MLNVILPTELEMCDLLAVARIHFPELGDDCLQLIGSKAMQFESFLAVEAIAKRVRYISKRDGHAEITIEDLDLAINEVMPSGSPVALTSPAKRSRPVSPRDNAAVIRPSVREVSAKVATRDIADVVTEGSRQEMPTAELISA